MFMRKQRVRNKRFNYDPRFYDPTKDDDLKQRMRIRRRALSKQPNTRQRAFIIFGLLLILVLYVYTNL